MSGILAATYPFRPGDQWLGCEFSGDVEAGHRKMGHVRAAVQALKSVNTMDLQVYNHRVDFDDGTVVVARRYFNGYSAEIFSPLRRGEQPEETFEKEVPLCVLYYDGTAYKSADVVFNKTGIKVKSNDVVANKMPSLAGRAPFFKRKTKIDVKVVDYREGSQGERVVARDVVIVASPFKIEDENLVYGGDPSFCTLDDGGYINSKIFVYVIDVESGKRCFLFQRMSMPGVTYSVNEANGWRYRECWGINWSEEYIFSVWATVIPGGPSGIDSLPATLAGKAFRLLLSVYDSGEEFAWEYAQEFSTNVNTAGESFTISNVGEIYYFVAADGIYAVDIFSGSSRVACKCNMYYPEDIHEVHFNESLWSLYLYEETCGFGVGFNKYVSSGWLVGIIDDDFTKRTAYSENKISNCDKTKDYVVSLMMTYYKYYSTYVPYDKGNSIGWYTVPSKNIIYPCAPTESKPSYSYTKTTKDVENLGGYYSAACSLDMSGLTIDTYDFVWINGNTGSSSASFAQPCNLCLSDLYDKENDQRIQALYVFNAENNTATPKKTIVIRNGVDVTESLAQALGVTPMGIMGIVDLAGIV